jgi:hypothetical protein
MRVAFAALVLALVVLVPSAGAKEGVWAELVTLPPAEALPGEQIQVSWTLQFLDNGVRKPFGAGGIFIRLLDAAHGAATTAEADRGARPGGFFEVTVQVPAGGIGGLQIGIHGTTDVYFPVRNNPYALRRPLQLPKLAPGEACPVAAVDSSLDWSGTYGIAPGVGQGPVYPVGLASGVLQIAPAKAFRSRSWGGQKILWFALPTYTGPVLIRGARIDGTGMVRFGQDPVPAKELLISGPQTAIPGGITPQKDARYRPSMARVQGPGCYAFQVDGRTFSRTIVFRAVRGY